MRLLSTPLTGSLLLLCPAPPAVTSDRAGVVAMPAAPPGAYRVPAAATIVVAPTAERLVEVAARPVAGASVAGDARRACVAVCR